VEIRKQHRRKWPLLTGARCLRHTLCVNIDTPQAVATPGNVFSNPSAGNMLGRQGGHMSTPVQTMAERQRAAPVQDWRTAEAYQSRAYQSSRNQPARPSALYLASGSLVVSLNLKRRHLNEGQRAMVAAKMANMPAHRPANNSANLQTSQTQAAELLQVSPCSVATAAKVERDAPPEIAQAVQSGAFSINLAAQLPEEGGKQTWPGSSNK
jgi:hypothetical protein